MDLVLETLKFLQIRFSGKYTLIKHIYVSCAVKKTYFQSFHVQISKKLNIGSMFKHILPIRNAQYQEKMFTNLMKTYSLSESGIEILVCLDYVFSFKAMKKSMLSLPRLLFKSPWHNIRNKLHLHSRILILTLCNSQILQEKLWSQIRHQTSKVPESYS